MQSYILLGEDEKKAEKYITDFQSSHAIPELNLIRYKEESSIGIDIIRQMKSSILTKPFGGYARMIVFYRAEKMTAEAQNSLLKTLEEPPAHTYILLQTESTRNILPTIISRTTLVKLNTQNMHTTDDHEYRAEIRKLLISTPGARILMSQKISTAKETAENFFDNVFVELEMAMKAGGTNAPVYASVLKKCMRARQLLEKNINVKLLMDNLFLSLPTIA